MNLSLAIGPFIYKSLVEKLRGHKLRRFRIIREVHNKIQGHIKSDFAMVQDSKMYLGTDDNYNLSIYGIYEPKETLIVKKMIKEGQNVIDIGASIGYYTLLFSRLVGVSGKVYAFESNLERFDLLRKNVQVNGYTNVILENKAISNKNGESIIFGEKAQTVSLDSYFNPDDKIDFVKIDVEGHEKHVFEGMKEILKQNHNIKIMFEFHPKVLAEYKTTSEELLKFIEDSNFKMFDILQDSKQITSDELIKAYPNKINASTNILCVKNN